ncbi:MAG: hypothetical protein V1827_00545 [Candidatus Micrarchaeota archaeon]
MKGQATIEFLLIFALSLGAISLLVAPLMAADGAMKGRAEDLEMIGKAEAAARAVEAMHYAGGVMGFDFRKEGIQHSVENGRFHASGRGKTMEVEGVFYVDRTEPI